MVTAERKCGMEGEKSDRESTETMEGYLIGLRTFRENDVDAIMEHANNPRTRYYINQVDIKTPADKERYVQSTVDKREKGTAHIYAVVKRSSGKLIGSAGIEGINEKNDSCYFGIVIYNPDDWDRGFGTEATRLLCNFAFGSLGLHSVRILVYDYNKRARHVYEKCGFTVSGRYRDGIRVRGEYRDVLIMDLLEGELVRF